MFQAHLDLLQFFLTRRDEIVERIQGVLNAQRKPIEYLRDRSLLSRHVEDCFFTVAGIPPDSARLRGQLEAAHWASGFKPRALPGLHNDLVDPAEMMVRAFHLWQQTRWPGRAGRIRYAHTLFTLHVIRGLALLSMRVWDDGSSGAGDRLGHVQRVLDRLRAMRAPDQPVFVRDARWLIPMAQSPATDDLGAYFDVAEKIATLPRDDRIAIHGAGMRMAGGHLRSQLHYYAVKEAVALDDERLVSSTRTSNALDVALLIQDLVPLLEAYERAGDSGDGRTRREFADAICQGLSPDPELFVNRVELLGAYSTIEHLFITTDDQGRAVHTPAGRRHHELFREYTALIGRLSARLHDECPGFRPRPGAYSPYGVLYGFSSDLLEHMALRSALPDAVTEFGLEDVFVSGDETGETLAWVNGWRRLPHLPPDVQQRFDYPHQFAEDVFARVERALRTRASDEGAAGHVPTGRLFVVASDAGADAPQMPDLPAGYLRTSDRQLAATGHADFQDEPRLLSDRREGKCLVSYRTPGGWVALSKAVLTEVLGTGRDAKIVGLPPEAAGALKLMCPDLVT